MDGGGWGGCDGAGKGKLRVHDLPVASGSPDPGAATTTAVHDSPPSPPPHPPPTDHTTEAGEMLAQQGRQYEQEMREAWAELEGRWQKRRELEQLREKNRARWEENAEPDRIERDLDVEEAALEKRKAMLTQCLLAQPEHKSDENDDAWDLSPIVWVIAMFSGSALLVLMCSLFPLVYMKHIVVAFAAVWALGSIVLSFRIFERFRGQNTLSHHAARLAFLCFTLLGLYALYLIALRLDDYSGASPSSASEP